MYGKMIDAPVTKKLKSIVRKAGACEIELEESVRKMERQEPKQHNGYVRLTKPSCR